MTMTMDSSSSLSGEPAATAAAAAGSKKRKTSCPQPDHGHGHSHGGGGALPSTTEECGTNNNKGEEESSSSDAGEGNQEVVVPVDVNNDTTINNDNTNGQSSSSSGGGVVGGASNNNNSSSGMTSGKRSSSSSVTLPISSLHQHLICSLCKGYFRDPYTISDCLHTFCRSCLVMHFRQGSIDICCPTCNTRLGADPFNTSIVNPSREIIPDRTLQEIVSKIFPHLKNKDEEAERRFYAQRGIQMKAEYHDAMMQEKETTTEKTNRNRLGGDDSLQAMISTDQLLDLKLEPDESPPTQVHRRLPSLRCSLLRLSGRAKIISLKKYLVMKLGLKETMSSIEILCCGESMGDDVRLSSISKTRSLPANTMLILKYRLDEGSERGTAADEGVP